MVDAKLNTNQWQTFTENTKQKKTQLANWDILRKAQLADSRNLCYPSLPGTGKVTPGILYPILGPPVQERYWETREDIVEGYQDSWEHGAHDLWGEIEEDGLISSKKERVRGDH